jgi:hypothetical protein
VPLEILAAQVAVRDPPFFVSVVGDRERLVQERGEVIV